MQGDWLDTELEMDGDFEMYDRQETAQHKITAFAFEVRNRFSFLAVFLDSIFAAGDGQPPEHRAVRAGGHGGASLPVRGVQLLLCPRP